MIISHRLENECIGVDEIYEFDVFFFILIYFFFLLCGLFFDCSLIDQFVCMKEGFGQVKISVNSSVCVCVCVNDLSAGLGQDNGRMKILMPLSYEFTQNVTVCDRINSPSLLTALLFTALLTKPSVAILVQEQDSFQVRLQKHCSP